MGSYRGPGYGQVTGAGGPCIREGCQFRHASELLWQATDALTERQRLVQQIMQYEGTLALWCSRGAHAFSELDPGRIIIPPASGRDEYGTEVTIPAQAICGEHAKGISKRRTRPVELEAPKDHYDPEYTADLERRLGMTPSVSLSEDE